MTDEAKSEPTRATRSGSNGLTWVGRLVAIITLVGAVFVLRGFLASSVHGNAAGPRSIIGRVVVPRTEAINEEVVVPAGGFALRGFNVPESVPVQLTAQGGSNSDSGFRVFIANEATCTAFPRTKQGQYVQPFYGMKVRSFSQTSTVAAGRYCAVVQNSENLMFSMSVRLQVTVNP